MIAAVAAPTEIDEDMDKFYVFGPRLRASAV
jgi:hypothetical protein